MGGLRRIGVLAAVVGSTAFFGATASTAPGLALAAAVKALPIADEMRAGYDRSAFTLWTDADRDGCNTRAEVLVAEAEQKPTIGAGCALQGGRWVSVYDGRTLTDASGLDIDHMVPLAEAWDSGARGWTSAQRQQFANDLGDPRSLVAVSASSNRSKGDRDPAEWLPTVGKCSYVASWVAVKTRWQLTVDVAERTALLRVAQDCDTATVAVAIVAGVTATAAPTPSPKPKPAPSPTPEPGGASVHYANCAAARAAGAAPLRAGDPGYRTALDGDRDGVACEGPTAAPAPVATATPAPTPAPTAESPTTPVPTPVPAGASVHYANCAAARAAGAAPLRAGDPGYRTALDGDKDGVACE